MEDMITPWRVEADERNYEVNGNFTPDIYIAGYNIYTADGDEVVGCEGIIDLTSDRADFIVHCVNSHASLVEENKRMREALEGVRKYLAENQSNKEFFASIKEPLVVCVNAQKMINEALGDTNA